MPGGGIGGRFIEVAPYVFRLQGRQETLVFETADDGSVTRVFLGSMPILVADKLAPWQTAANHQIVIGLALLAALFVLINATRSRGQVRLAGPARLGRYGLVLAAASFLAFGLGLAVVMGNSDMEQMIFDFPPPGTGLVLVLPLVGALATIVCVGVLVPVWRSPACNVWQRIRYTYVTVLFLLLVGVLGYWNMLGWRY